MLKILNGFEHFQKYFCIQYLKNYKILSNIEHVHSVYMKVVENVGSTLIGKILALVCIALCKTWTAPYHKLFFLYYYLEMKKTFFVNFLLELSLYVLQLSPEYAIILSDNLYLFEISTI